MWYKYLVDPESLSKPQTTENFDENITKLPKTIGFPDLTLILIGRIIYDIQNIKDFSTDQAWIGINQAFH